MTEDTFIAWYLTAPPVADGAHDLGHFGRVWRMCRRINALEGGSGDLVVLLAASYFHDLVSLPKDHPDRSRSSLFSAASAAPILLSLGFPSDKIAAVKHAIEAHSFSAGIVPTSFEARVLQDADRMEALGAIGIARTFYTAGFMHSAMFDASDPLGHSRTLDDTRFALDHFSLKLLALPSLMQTAAGRLIASERARILVEFRAQLVAEISADL
jgi:uncharacterized protein